MTPSYSLLSEEHFQAIKDRYPNTKPIFLMRDPVDRYWSAMRMGARDDGSASALSLVESNLENPQHLLRGRYDLTVQALDAVFGEDAYLAIFSEELYQQSSINRICKYLGIMEREADFQKRENASPENETLDVEARKRIFDAFSPVYRFFDSRGVILPAKWRQSMEQYG